MYCTAFGEILWDIIEGEAHLGGAPFNLTAHLAQMGAETSFISGLGKDDLGERALEKAKGFGTDTRLISLYEEYPTGTVDVTIDEYGSPDYIIHESTAWDNIELSSEQKDILRSTKVDALAFGTLAQRSEKNRKTLEEVFSLIQPRHVLYDVNLRQDYYQADWIRKSMDRASIIKVNDEEAVTLSKVLFQADLTEQQFCERVVHSFSPRVVVVTRGGEGVACHDGCTFTEIPGKKVEVVNTVGSGDGFAAGFLFAALEGAGWTEAAEFANNIGGYVATQPGAIPDYTEEIRSRLSSLQKK